MDKEYEVSAREIHFITTGGCFYCILGEHYNEGYLAIINWGIATTIAPVMERDYKVSAVKYNTEQIYKALSDSLSAQKYFPNDDVRYKVSNELAERVTNEMILYRKAEPIITPPIRLRVIKAISSTMSIIALMICILRVMMILRDIPISPTGRIGCLAFAILTCAINFYCLKTHDTYQKGKSKN